MKINKDYIDWEYVEHEKKCAEQIAEAERLREENEILKLISKSAYLYVVANERGTWDDRRVLYNELKGVLLRIGGDQK